MHKTLTSHTLVDSFADLPNIADEWLPPPDPKRMSPTGKALHPDLYRDKEGFIHKYTDKTES